MIKMMVCDRPFFSNDMFWSNAMLMSNWFQLWLIDRFNSVGLVNAIDNHLRLKIRVVCLGNF